MTENFSRFTVESLSASYIPFPRFLMEDTLANLSNDAKVLYALEPFAKGGVVDVLHSFSHDL